MKYFILIMLSTLFFQCQNLGKKDGDSLFKENKHEEAITAYSELLETDKENISILYNRGRAYEELKKYEKAKEDFQKVLDLDPKNINSLLSLSKIYYGENNYKKSLIYSSKVLNITKESENALFLTGRALHHFGKSIEALEHYNKALKLNDKLGEVFLYRGALKTTMNKLKSACIDFKKAQNLGVLEAEKALKKYCN